MLSGSSRAADEGGRDIDARILPYVFRNNTLQLVYDYISLMEGWDAITVTHVRGVGAFGTQLLCEQVIGGALRQSCRSAMMSRSRWTSVRGPLDTRMRSIIICRHGHADTSERPPRRLEGRGNPRPYASQAAAGERRSPGRRDEVIIEHAGQEYHLRHTRAGKLILTK